MPFFMPVHISERNGEYCVVEPSGKVVHCHDTRGEALAQLRALNSEEEKGKATMGELTESITTITATANQDTPAIDSSGWSGRVEDDGDVLKSDDTEEKMFAPIITDFDELDAFREVQDEVNEAIGVVSDFMTLAGNVMDYEEDKIGGIKRLAEQMISRLKGAAGSGSSEKDNTDTETGDEIKVVMKVAKEVSDEVIRSTGFLVWKDGGTWRWLGVYSNKFRDDDKPVAEILSEAAHKEFIDRVETGEVGYPDLYVWHIEVPVGKADLLAYDDSGFSVVSGTFTNISVAKALLNAKQELAMSHGMPAEFIERDKDDPSVITRYVSTEVSVLPRYAAANKRTSFNIIPKEKTNMSLDPELRGKVVDMIGEDATAGIEGQLANEAEKAIEANIDFKEEGTIEEVAEADTATETTEEVVEADVDVTEEPVVEETTLEVEVEIEVETPVVEPEIKDDGEEANDEAEGDKPEDIVTALKQELTQVLAGVVKAVDDNNKAIAERMTALEERMVDISKDEDERLAEKAAGMTTASLASMLASQLAGSERAESVIGNPATHVHGNSKLAKDAPEQDENGGTPQPDGMFFDQWTKN